METEVVFDEVEVDYMETINDILEQRPGSIEVTGKDDDIRVKIVDNNAIIDYIYDLKEEISQLLSDNVALRKKAGASDELSKELEFLKSKQEDHLVCQKLKSELQEEYNVLCKIRDKLERKIVRLSENSDHVTMQLSKANEQIVFLKDQNLALTQERDLLNSIESQKGEEREKLLSAVEKFEKTFSSMQEEFLSLQKLQFTLQRNYDSLFESNLKMENEYALAKEKLENFENSSQKLKTGVKKTKNAQQNADLQNYITQLQNYGLQLETNILELQKELSAISAKLLEAQSEIEENKKQHRNELEQRQKDLNESNNVVKLLLSEIQKLNTKNSEQLKQISQLKKISTSGSKKAVYF